jgi:transposase-like protein
MGAARKRFGAEQIVNLLRQIEVLQANGKSLPEACRAAGIAEQTYYRWRRAYGGLKLDQAKRLKELEAENARLKRVVADLALREAMLKEVAKGNF